MNDLEEKLNFLVRNYWSVVRQQETLIIWSSIKSPNPKINLSLVIESDFAVYVFCIEVEINKIGDYNIPKHVTDQNSLEIQIKKTWRKWTQNNSKPKLRIWFLYKIGIVISTIGARRMKHLCSSRTDQVLHRRIENAIHITWQISNWSPRGHFLSIPAT